jgi:hypothetical protein
MLLSLLPSTCKNKQDNDSNDGNVVVQTTTKMDDTIHQQVTHQQVMPTQGLHTEKEDTAFFIPF